MNSIIWKKEAGQENNKMNKIDKPYDDVLLCIINHKIKKCKNYYKI